MAGALGSVPVCGAVEVRPGGARSGVEEVRAAAVHFHGLRYNRARQSWNVSVTVSNGSTQPLRGPLSLEVQGAFSNVRAADERGQELGRVDLSGCIPAGGLGPGQRSRPRSLTLIPLEAQGSCALHIVARVHAIVAAGSVDESSAGVESASDAADGVAEDAAVLSASGLAWRELASVVGPPQTNILQTGAGLPLLTIELPVEVPDTLPFPTLSFAFGFATEESVTPGEFLDAFTVTLQTEDRSATAVLFTADASGVVWGPPTPGGVAGVDGRLVRVPVPFPSLATHLPGRRAFAVTYGVAPAFAGRSATVFLDLFDNQDGRASLAFMNRPSFRPGLVVVESSAAATGPYAEERTFDLNAGARRFTSLASGTARFFRLRSSHATRITSIVRESGDWVLDYTFEPPVAGGPEPVPVLESSAAPAGPFAREPGVVVEAGARRLRLRGEGSARFYRLRSTTPLAIRRIEVQRDRIVLDYE